MTNATGLLRDVLDRAIEDRELVLWDLAREMAGLDGVELGQMDGLADRLAGLRLTADELDLVGQRIEKVRTLRRLWPAVGGEDEAKANLAAVRAEVMAACDEIAQKILALKEERRLLGAPYQRAQIKLDRVREDAKAFWEQLPDPWRGEWADAERRESAASSELARATRNLRELEDEGVFARLKREIAQIPKRIHALYDQERNTNLYQARKEQLLQDKVDLEKQIELERERRSPASIKEAKAALKAAEKRLEEARNSKAVIYEALGRI